MPERVTREERRISMAIQKARDAKEVLYQSIMDNNRSPMKDESEHVKVKRPKAEKGEVDIKTNEGTHSGYGLAGQITKAIRLLKAVKESDYETNPFLDDEERRTILNAIDETERAISELKTGLTNADKQDKDDMREILIRMSQAITQLEKELDAIPEQTMFYDSENSEKTIDPEYQRDR
tara:strand:+ start:24550 stop:25086 length:537 start_codon:yes stop_codon:yes gene_type:complete